MSSEATRSSPSPEVPASAALGRPLFVVFGGTGDLMQRKLLPALLGLARAGWMPSRSAVLGVARDAHLDNSKYRGWALGALEALGPVGPDARSWVADQLHYQSIGAGTAEQYAQLAERIALLEGQHGLSGHRVFHLALPLGAVGPTVEGLGGAGLARGSGWTRLVLEKPFGSDLDSARQLNATIHRYFDESQVFRLDHYLGKETVQNLLAFRFANPIFESIWNRDRVERVEVTVAEALGVEHRAAYYDQAGALRDMVQNHLTQLLALMAMEPPVAFEAEAIRNEKVKLLRSTAQVAPEDAVFGQYAAGTVEGRRAAGYREEPGVPATSRTETFVAARLAVRNWRWNGVPIVLKTGKRLARRGTEIVVTFRRPPVAPFESWVPETVPANQLVITIQPDEGFDLVFNVKAPGQETSLNTERMHFRYTEAFGPLPDDYQTLLLDVLKGDATLFVRHDEVEEAWRVYGALLTHPPVPVAYPAGGSGPACDTLLGEGTGSLSRA